MQAQRLHLRMGVHADTRRAACTGGCTVGLRQVLKIQLRRSAWWNMRVPQHLCNCANKVSARLQQMVIKLWRSMWVHRRIHLALVGVLAQTLLTYLCTRACHAGR